MKVIFSKKGFDSEYGKIASPLLEDGTFLSLPIPQKTDKLCYTDIHYNKKTYDEIIFELSKLGLSYRFAHLDPDLRYESKKRILEENKWCGLFGQSGPAQGILRNCNIGKGDIFLFYGWFKEAESKNGMYHYKEKSQDFNAIWGYLEIDEIIDTKEKYDKYKSINPDVIDHPHARYFEENIAIKKNCIYTGAKELFFNKKLSGFGCIQNKTGKTSPKLTEAGKTKSNWMLPNDIFGDIKFDSHNKSFDNNGRVSWKTFGQEFVIDCKKHPKVENWVKNLIEENASCN